MIKRYALSCPASLLEGSLIETGPNKSAAGFVAVVLVVLGSLSEEALAQTVTYVHTDALGSIVAETAAAGTVTSRREYEPYGAQLTPALRDGPGYTGHVQDAATGLNYLQQRYYDQKLGVFLSADPVSTLNGPMSQFNRYRYANSNPYRFVDPDGRLGCAASRIPSVCSSYGMGPKTAIEAGWSQDRRESTADALISRAERRLENRSEGNRFESPDEAARFFKRQFAKHSTFLQLEFGGAGVPQSNKIVNLSRSVGDEIVDGVGLFVSIQVPYGGVEFHTHPDFNPRSVGFSQGDLVSAMGSGAVASYIFYGYPGYQGKKFDVSAAEAAGASPYRSDIHLYIQDFND